MFFNGWIKFTSETYLFLAVCVCLNLNYLVWGSTGDAFNSLCTIFFALVLIAFPIFVAIFYPSKKYYA